MTINFKNIHFAQYRALVKSFSPTISGLIVFDRDANLIWQDNEHRVDEEQLRSLAAKFLRSDSDSHSQNQLNGDLCEWVKLKDQYDVPVLILCLCHSQSDKAQSDSASMPILAEQKVFVQLSEMLLSDYSQNIDIAAKEDELILMTDELTRRYEELNLIYKAEDQAINTLNGR